jgi:hypothetical protein
VTSSPPKVRELLGGETTGTTFWPALAVPNGHSTNLGGNTLVERVPIVG